MNNMSKSRVRLGTLEKGIFKCDGCGREFVLAVTGPCPFCEEGMIGPIYEGEEWKYDWIDD